MRAQETSQPKLSNDFMLLATALQPIATELQVVKQRLHSYLESTTESAESIISHIFNAGGKHIRPALYLMSCKLVGYKGPYLYPIAAVCEYVHAASLLHDDVVDSSMVRRNKPTSNSIWGDESAVLVGDLIYATASELMASTGKLEIVTNFAQAIKQMSEGELLQLENIMHYNLEEKTYLKILYNKTAVLMGSACRAAGILASASDDQKEALFTFGCSLGTSFQLIDDALDYLGNEKQLGKQSYDDLKEGKVTLPIILLKTLLSPEEEKKIARTFSQANTSAEDFDFVIQMVKKYKTAQSTIAKAKAYTTNALNALLNNFAPSEDRDHLEQLAKTLLQRAH